MPHDRDGRPLRVGDVAIVPVIIKEIHQTADWCNVTVETSEPMWPGHKYTTIVLNSAQVIGMEVPQGIDGVKRSE